MTKQEQKTDGPDKNPVDKGKPDVNEAGDNGGEGCRCEEVSKKTPRELLKLMLSDLAFWKKK